MPASTTSGGSSSAAPTISRRDDLLGALGLVLRPLEQQLVVDLQHGRVAQAGVRQRVWQRTIATLMMSAAVPWMTVLTASRSPSLRVWRLRARSSGIWRRRPNSVVT